MDGDFLNHLAAQGLTISGLTRLANPNPLNQTCLYQGKLLQNGKSQSIFIKRLLYSNTVHYQQFHQEISTLKACRALAITDDACPKPPYGVAKLLSYYLKLPCPFLILPLYQGQTLKYSIRNNILTLEQKIDIMISLCHLLDKIHCLGYSHGDIKPSNILLTDTNRLILLDFGLSRAINTTRILSKTDATAGTPAYMSPEQFNGRGFTPQSDYYSLGVVLVELFTGLLPFFADNLTDWATSHCQRPFLALPKVTGLTTNQQQTLQLIVEKLLAPYPENRFDNLADVVALLSTLAF